MLKLFILKNALTYEKLVIISQLAIMQLQLVKFCVNKVTAHSQVKFSGDNNITVKPLLL